MSKRLWIVFVLIVIAIIATHSFSTTTTKQSSPVAEKLRASETSEALQENRIFITIEGLYSEVPVYMLSGGTALTLLRELDARDTRVQLGVKEYAGLGALVVSMHGEKNGTDDRYWQYTVNHVAPQIGADAYVLHDGDVVEWRFAESSY